jgi:hypothetical protein
MLYTVGMARFEQIAIRLSVAEKRELRRRARADGVREPSVWARERLLEILGHRRRTVMTTDGSAAGRSECPPNAQEGAVLPAAPSPSKT